MTRRALTLLLASVLALGLAIAGSVATVPYVALRPGPAFNTLGNVGGTDILTITGGSPRTPGSSEGALDLTTVSVADHITLFEAIEGWISPNDAVVPREIVYPPDQTTAQSNATNTVEMQQSQDSATTAALTELGYPATVVVSATGKGSPAEGKVLVGDVITSVDGTTVTSTTQLRTLISKHAVGEAVDLVVSRGGRSVSLRLITAKAPDSTGRAIIGVTPTPRFAVKVSIMLKDVGGPSAGLMFALGIVNKLSPEPITGGKTIAGTGEITDDGTVGAIGGIAQKMRGAKARGATVFLSPADNCSEAKKTKPSGITLIKVSTLKGALAALQTLRTGGKPPSC